MQRKREAEELVKRLRIEPSDNGGPNRIELRERQEAADLIESLADALIAAEKACSRARACMSRWQSGKPFNPEGPEAAIQEELYEVIRPGASEGIRKLNTLLEAQRKSRECRD